MNLRDLHYFAILAEVMHFGEAAKRCFISQPTLSMQIKKLEDTLGVTLFERTNKHVFLTEQGSALLIRVKKILVLVTEMKEVARNSMDPFAGNLRLGVIPTVAPYLLPLVMPALQEHFPNLKVWLVEEQTPHLVKQLTEGELDAAIMAQPIDEPFTYRLLLTEDFYFACAKNNSLANNHVIAVEDLADQQVLLLAEGHCLRDQAMAVCKTAKANEIADFTATSLETLRLMVQSGNGVTLLPALAVWNTSSDSLKCIPFSKPVPSRDLGLFWRTHTAKSQCLEAMAELIRELLAMNQPRS